MDINSRNYWRPRNELEVLGVAPDFLAPVFDELGVPAILGLELLEAAAEDQDLVGDVLAVAVEPVACLGVYLDGWKRGQSWR